MYSRKLLLLPHSEIFQPIHVLLHTLLNRKPRFPSKVLKRTLNAQCAQIVISQVAGANMDRCSGKQFASLINNTCVWNHLSAANIIFGMRVMICQGNASTDCGKTITLRGHADIPGRSFDEHMLVEKKDGALWMLVRTFKGIGESFSTDGGYTWTPGRNSHIDGPCSRFFIRRLKSGRLLMINHYNFDQRIDLDDIMNQGNVKSWKGRSHLTAMLSEDDGETWPYTLLLDERNEVSYPDAKEADNGYIYVTYDWERVTQREILMARFTEDDILRGKILSPEGKLRVLVNKALGQPDIH